MRCEGGDPDTEELQLKLPEGLSLQRDEKGLFLTSEEGLQLRGDFSHLAARLKHHNLSGELVVKAAKTRGKDALKVLDATAGLGEDSFLLAGAGFQVELYEYDPVIAALLNDAIGRAVQDESEEVRQAALRMALHEGDSIEAMRKIAAEAEANGGASVRQPDVILLDPMFPERKKSGLIKKKFQLLQQLEKPCDDEEALLSAAIAVHPSRIIIKRPLKGPFLAGRKPDYSLPGKAIRYDVILL